MRGYWAWVLRSLTSSSNVESNFSFFKSLSVVRALEVLTLGYLERSATDPVGDAAVVRVIRGGSTEVFNFKCKRLDAFAR